MDIRDCIRRIEAGDHAAYATIVEQFQRPLFAYLGRMGFAQAVAEELAQEAFLRAWRQLASYQPARGAFSTWLFTIARHLALDELQRSPPPGALDLESTCANLASEAPQPDAAALVEQARRQLRAALCALSPADRSVIALAYLKELDLASVAAIEGCTVGTVKVRLHRARARLRQLLENSHGR
jgi:RNA polymerase sigma-70 factor (ECF subfamily)